MKFVVAANWKMFKNPSDTQKYFATFRTYNIPDSIQTLFFVPAVNAATAALSLEKSPISWGPQNIYPAANGAFTGETSPEVMKELGARYVLVGHSERRQLFHESDEVTRQKMDAAQQFDLNPVLCIGETLAERKQGQTNAVLERQLRAALDDFSVKNQLCIAYEPVWAIGTGQVATPDQVAAAHTFVRQMLNQFLPKQEIPILYGGSVKPENASELAKTAEVGGFLVGGASLQPESFYAIIKASLQ